MQWPSATNATEAARSATAPESASPSSGCAHDWIETRNPSSPEQPTRVACRHCGAKGGLCLGCLGSGQSRSSFGSTPAPCALCAGSGFVVDLLDPDDAPAGDDGGEWTTIATAELAALRDKIRRYDVLLEFFMQGMDYRGDRRGAEADLDALIAVAKVRARRRPLPRSDGGAAKNGDAAFPPFESADGIGEDD